MYKLVIILLLLSIATAQDIREYVRNGINDAPIRESSSCAKSTYEPNIRIRVRSIEELRVYGDK